VRENVIYFFIQKYRVMNNTIVNNFKEIYISQKNVTYILNLVYSKLYNLYPKDELNKNNKDYLLHLNSLQLYIFDTFFIQMCNDLQKQNKLSLENVIILLNKITMEQLEQLIHYDMNLKKNKTNSQPLKKSSSEQLSQLQQTQSSQQFMSPQIPQTQFGSPQIPQTQFGSQQMQQTQFGSQQMPQTQLGSQQMQQTQFGSQQMPQTQFGSQQMQQTQFGSQQMQQTQFGSHELSRSQQFIPQKSEELLEQKLSEQRDELSNYKNDENLYKEREALFKKRENDLDKRENELRKLEKELNNKIDEKNRKIIKKNEKRNMLVQTDNIVQLENKVSIENTNTSNITNKSNEINIKNNKNNEIMTSYHLISNDSYFENGTYKFKVECDKIKSINLIRFWMQCNMYNINEYNNKFYIYENDYKITINIPIGYYKIEELVNTIEILMNKFSINKLKYKVFRDQFKNKVFFTCFTRDDIPLNFILMFENQNLYTSLNKILGFKLLEYSGNNIYVSENHVQENIFDNIYLRLFLDDKEVCKYIMSNGSSYFECFNLNYGNYFGKGFDIKNEDMDAFDMFENINCNEISIELVDIEGKLLLKPIEFHIVIGLECLE
jgi:hypothetical protein